MKDSAQVGAYLRRSLGLPAGTEEQQQAALEALLRVLMYFGTEGIIKAVKGKP